MNDEYGNSAIAELVGLVSLTSQNRSPHHMAPLLERAAARCGRRSPTRCSPTTSGPPRVGPIGAGQHLAAGENREVDDDPGKLTQDECNAAAKAFQLEAFDLRHYDDDIWIKNNPDDPKAAELAAATRRLRCRGAGRAVGGRSATCTAPTSPGCSTGPPAGRPERPAIVVGDRPVRTWAELRRGGRPARRRPARAATACARRRGRAVRLQPSRLPRDRCSRSGTPAASRCRSRSRLHAREAADAGRPRPRQGSASRPPTSPRA